MSTTETVSTKPLTETDLEALCAQLLFEGVDLASLHDFLDHCEVRSYEEDEVLIKSGDEQHFLHMIIGGRFRVHLPVDTENPVAILQSGECIGEIALVDRQPASASVIADIASRTFVIDHDVFWQMLQHNHRIALNLLMVLTKRLREGHSVITRIRELLSEHEYNATVDSLTGLYNRRWLDSMLPRVSHRCQTSNMPLSALMIDLDHFKQYNDQHGHIAGDAALRQVSQTLLGNLRPEDHLARYGGEELFAMLPGQDMDSALNVSERLREAVSQLDIRNREKKQLPPVTISIGVACLGKDEQPADLLRTADEALYRAKNAGRNRVSQ